MSFYELKQVFEREPFSLRSSKKLELLTRYLTEDSSQQYVIFNPEALCGITLIREKFINLIGDYDILKDYEIEEAEAQIKQKLSQAAADLSRELSQ